MTKKRRSGGRNKPAGARGRVSEFNRSRDAAMRGSGARFARAPVWPARSPRARRTLCRSGASAANPPRRSSPRTRPSSALSCATWSTPRPSATSRTLARSRVSAGRERGRWSGLEARACAGDDHGAARALAVLRPPSAGGRAARLSTRRAGMMPLSWSCSHPRRRARRPARSPPPPPAPLSLLCRIRPPQDLPQGLLLHLRGDPLQDRARALGAQPPRARAPAAAVLRRRRRRRRARRQGLIRPAL
jgi:hypothetical protein